MKTKNPRVKGSNQRPKQCGQPNKSPVGAGLRRPLPQTPPPDPLPQTLMGLFGLLRTSHGPLRASAGLYRPQPALTGHMGPQRASHGHLRATTGLFGYTGLSWANAGLNWPLMDLYGPLRASHGLLMGHFGPHGPSTGLSRASAGHKALSWASIGLYVLLPGLYRPLWA